VTAADEKALSSLENNFAAGIIAAIMASS